MRVAVAVVLFLVIVFGSMAQPARAQLVFAPPQSIGFPFVTTPAFIETIPFSNIGFVAVAANTSTLASSCEGTLAIAFAPVASRPQACAKMAFPVIAQTVDETVVGESSWFYADHTT